MGNPFVAVSAWFLHTFRSVLVDFHWPNEFVARTLAVRGRSLGKRTYSWLIGYLLQLVALEPGGRIRSPYWKDRRLHFKHPVWAALSQVRAGSHEENEPQKFLVALAGEQGHFPSEVCDAAYREALKRAMSPIALITSFPRSTAARRVWEELLDVEKPALGLALLKTNVEEVWIGTVYSAIQAKAEQSDDFAEDVVKAVLERLELKWDTVATREALYSGLLPMSVKSLRHADAVVAALKFLFSLRGAQFGRNGVVDALYRVDDEVLKKAVKVVVGDALQWSVLLALYEMVAHTSDRVQALGRRIAAGLGDDVVRLSHGVIEPIARGHSDSIFLQSLLARSRSMPPVAVSG